MKCPEKWELASASAKVQRSRICSRSAAIYACSLALLYIACWKRNTLRWFPVRLVKTTIKSRHHIKGCKQRSKNWMLLAGRERAKYLHFQLKNAPSLLYICESKICLKFSVFMRRNEELTPIPIRFILYISKSPKTMWTGMPFRVNYLVNCLVDYCYVDERRVPLYFRHYPIWYQSVLK